MNPFVSDIVYSFRSLAVNGARAHRQTGDIHWEGDEATITEKRLLIKLVLWEILNQLHSSLLPFLD